MWNRRPFLVVVSAPSGAGKTTICRIVAKRAHKLRYSVSATTRPKRKGERDKFDYYFLSKDEFQHWVEQGRFLEYAQVFGYYYGTPKGNLLNYLARGDDVIMDLDIQGSRTIRQLYPDCVTIFLVPPSFDELKQRLARRAANPPAEINERITQAQSEMEAMSEFDYLVINRELEMAVHNILSIITAERLRTNRL